MNEELKSCPFCGSTNIHVRTLPAFFHEVGRGWAVVCFGCFARGPYVKNEKYGRTSHSAEAKRDAIEAWNRMAEGRVFNANKERRKKI